MEIPGGNTFTNPDFARQTSEYFISIRLLLFCCSGQADNDPALKHNTGKGEM